MSTWYERRGSSSENEDDTPWYKRLGSSQDDTPWYERLARRACESAIRAVGEIAPYGAAGMIGGYAANLLDDEPNTAFDYTPLGAGLSLRKRLNKYAEDVAPETPAGNLPQRLLEGVVGGAGPMAAQMGIAALSGPAAAAIPGAAMGAFDMGTSAYEEGRRSGLNPLVAGLSAIPEAALGAGAGAIGPQAALGRFAPEGAGLLRQLVTAGGIDAATGGIQRAATLGRQSLQGLLAEGYDWASDIGESSAIQGVLGAAGRAVTGNKYTTKLREQREARAREEAFRAAGEGRGILPPDERQIRGESGRGRLLPEVSGTRPEPREEGLAPEPTGLDRERLAPGRLPGATTLRTGAGAESPLPGLAFRGQGDTPDAPWLGPERAGSHIFGSGFSSKRDVADIYAKGYGDRGVLHEVDLSKHVQNPFSRQARYTYDEVRAIDPEGTVAQRARRIEGIDDPSQPISGASVAKALRDEFFEAHGVKLDAHEVDADLITNSREYIAERLYKAGYDSEHDLTRGEDAWYLHPERAAKIIAEQQAKRSPLAPATRGTKEAAFRQVPRSPLEGIPETATGPSRADEFVNLTKFAYDDPSGEGRLRSEVDRIVQGRGLHPKEVVTEKQTRALADEMGLSELMRKDPSRLNGPELLAIRNITSSNIDEMVKVSRALEDPATGTAARKGLEARLAGLDAKNVRLLERYMKGSSQKGRDPQNMKYVASLTRDPVLWIGKAMQWAGKDALTPELRLKISEMAAAGDREGYVNLVSGLKRSTPLQRTLG